jgi:hypothetical protein
MGWGINSMIKSLALFSIMAGFVLVGLSLEAAPGIIVFNATFLT